MIGQSAFRFLHPEDQAANAALFGQVLAQPEALIPWQARYQRSDGTWGWMEGTSVNLLGEPSVGAIVLNYRDVTARKQAEHDLQRSAKRLTALHAIDRAILLADSLTSIADTVLVYLRRLVPCERASVLLFEQGAGAATLLAVAADEWTEPSPGSRIPLESFYLSEQFEHGRPYLIADVHALGQAEQWMGDQRTRTVLLAPLIVRGELLGAISVQSATPGVFTDEHAAIMHEVG